MTAVPAIHASQLVPLLGLLSEAGAPIERLLEEEGLSPTLLRDPQGYAPAEKLFNFMSHAGETQGIEHVGWQSGMRGDLAESGSWAEHVGHASTLRGALEMLIEHYPVTSPLVRLGLKEDETTEIAWLWRRRLVNLKKNPGHVEVEQFTLARFISVIRLAAGDEWLPNHLKIETPCCRTGPLPEAMTVCRIDYEVPTIAIAIPHDLLDLPIRQVATLDRFRSGCADPTPPTLEDFLLEMLRPDVRHERLSIGLAADTALMSPRSLSRQLHAEGTGWRDIRKHLLLDRSKVLLRNSELPIGEIATELGYSDSAHFTRAFESWQGVSPSRFRAQPRSPRS